MCTFQMSTPSQGHISVATLSFEQQECALQVRDSTLGRHTPGTLGSVPPIP